MNRLREIRAQLSERLKLLWETQGAPRYNSLQEREQRILKIAAMVLPAIILVFTIMLPIHDRETALRQAAARSATDAAEAQQLAKQLQEHGGMHNVQHGDLLSEVEAAARATGARKYITRIRPEPGLSNGPQRLRLSMKEMPYAKVLEFLGALADKGLRVPELKLQTAAPGIVHAQASVQDS